MKKVAIGMMILILMFVSSACVQNQTQNNKIVEIDFSDNQMYAVAYLGYQDYEDLDNLSNYLTKYQLDENIPIHYFSPGEYYLVIPRYENTDLKLYKNTYEMDTIESTLVYEQKNMLPFVIQCNISDIFPDARISLTYSDEEVSFSPYRSLKDGSVQVGERGKNITDTSTVT